MGVVYLAHDARLQRRVALKTINVPQGLDRAEVDSFRERFLREAQAAGGISHPGIVTIYGVDECAEEVMPFITMEYVAGNNLREILKQEGRLEPSRAFRIADALADALHTAHGAGVIHRDIKPANVLVRESDGAVKIADFGVAHLTLNELTRSGEMVGTPAYMAPEQIRNGAADERSDLFALGVILYEMLAGARPFAGNDMAEIIHQVVYQEALPITQCVEGLPSVINAFFDRALAKSPRDRFQSGAQFREVLNDVQLEYEIERSGGVTLNESSPFTEVTPAEAALSAVRSWRWRQFPLPVYGAAAAALLLTLLLGWALLRHPSAAEPRATVAAEPPVPVAATTATTDAGIDAAVPQPADAALGESNLVPEEIDGDAAATAAAAPEPTPKAERKAAPPKPKSKPAPPPEPAAAVAVAQTPEPVVDAAPDAPAAASASEPPVAAAVPEPALLTLVTRSAIKEGTLTLFVDGEETLTLDLSSESKGFARFYRKALGRGAVSEAGVLDLPPGPHRILARLVRPGKEHDREATLDVDLAEGESSNLVIVAGRLFRSGLVLKLE